MGDQLEPQMDFEERKFAAEIELKTRALEIEERKVAVQSKTLPATLTSLAVPALSSLAGALIAVVVTAQNNLDVVDAEALKALQVQDENSKLELELQIRQQRFEIIVQATKDVKRDVASDNLLFFVDAGILTDEDGKIRKLAEDGDAPELGAPQPANDLKTSDAGVNFLKQFINPSLTKKKMPDGTDTIGYNHWVIAPSVSLENGDVIDLTQEKITEPQAEALLKQDLKEVEESINSSVSVKLTQSQFDALVSFVSHIGPNKFEKSTVLRKINSGDFDSVPDLMRNWKNVAGKEIPSAKARRELEVKLWSHATK